MSTSFAVWLIDVRGSGKGTPHIGVSRAGHVDAVQFLDEKIHTNPLLSGVFQLMRHFYSFMYLVLQQPKRMGRAPHRAPRVQSKNGGAFKVAEGLCRHQEEADVTL